MNDTKTDFAALLPANANYTVVSGQNRARDKSSERKSQKTAPNAPNAGAGAWQFPELQEARFKTQVSHFAVNSTS